VTNDDIEAANFEHVCQHCSRSFSTHHGMAVHIGRWCGEAQREEYVNRFAVDHINDARGPPGNRFYLVHWLGKNETNVTIGGCAPGRKWTPTWEPERFLIDAQKRIDTFWNDSDHSMQDTIECSSEHRCQHCCFFAKTSNGLKTHKRRCKSVPGSRTGQKSVEEIRHRRRKDAWLRRDTVEMGDIALPINSVKTDRRVPPRTPSNAAYGCWLHFGSSRPNGSLRCIVPAAMRTKLRQSVPNREPIGPDCATTDLEINTGQHDHGYSYSYSRGRKACTRVRSHGHSIIVKGLLRTLPQEKC